jgi:hypothetical protein
MFAPILRSCFANRLSSRSLRMPFRIAVACAAVPACVPAGAVHAGFRAGPILSEAMADPAAVADAQGEFLEIGNPGEDTLRLDSLSLHADAQRFTLTALSIGPGKVFLVCRDSVPAENGGMACDRQWSGLSLANARGAGIGLEWAGGSETYALPAPKPGVSWENTWDDAAGYRVFLPSAGARPGGDSATPGTRNSRSIRAAARDLGIVRVTWIPGSGSGGPGRDAGGGGSGGGAVETVVGDFGAGIPPSSHLCLRLDADWDGEAETFIDSLPLDLPSGGRVSLRTELGPGLRGIVHAALDADENPANDAFLLRAGTGRPLAISEWRAAPAPGEPEWVEIRNATGDSGGTGRRLEMSAAGFNGVPLGARAGALEPGGFLVLASDLDGFRARYGALKVRAIQLPGWAALRNTGDTLRLSLAGFPVDSVAYDARGRLVFGPDGSREGTAPPGASGGTPGYAVEPVVRDGWTLSGRMVGPGRPLDVEVRSVSREYVLRVFDLEGNVVRELGRGGPGKRRHGWDGSGSGGNGLRPGPYILGLSLAGAAPRRRAVILTDDR